MPTLTALKYLEIKVDLLVSVTFQIPSPQPTAPLLLSQPFAPFTEKETAISPVSQPSVESFSNLRNLHTLKLLNANLSSFSNLPHLEHICLSEKVLAPEDVHVLATMPALRTVEVLNFRERFELRSQCAQLLPLVYISCLDPALHKSNVKHQLRNWE